MNSMYERAKEDKLQKLREDIEKNLQTVDIKPYSHNIISLTLRQIDKEYGREKANKCIDDFRLEDLGWSKEE